MRYRWLIAFMLCIVIFSFILFNYNSIFMNEKFPSKKDAGEVADWIFRKSIQENDPTFESWKQSTLGEPILVRTVEEEPSYWTIPVIFKEKVIGFIDVDRNKSIPRYGTFGGSPDNLSAFPSVLTFTTPGEAFELAKNITAKYPDANISAPILVYDGDPGNIAWMLKVEKEGKTISRVFVAGGRFVYERIKGEIIKNVGGIDIAFEENITENEVKSIIDSYNLILPYELNYNVIYIGPFFYSIIPEDDFERIKNNLKEKEIYLSQLSKKRNRQIIIAIEGDKSENELIPIMDSYNLSLKRFIWVSVDYKSSIISEEDGDTLKESLYKNEKVIYVSLVYRKG